MAKIISNNIGFRAIQMSYAEIGRLTGNPNPVCDFCANPKVSQGYYIAVLNQWYCKKCYTRWLKTAKAYPEDEPIEAKNFNYYKNLLEKAGMLK